MISIIVAVSEDWGIGRANDLLWNIPDDMKRFKNLTMGNTVVMGKKTWESLPKRPLPGRKNIVITDDPNEIIVNAVTAYSIEDSVKKCENDNAVFIIGGGSIYKQFMPIADRLYITHVHSKAPADVYFPEIDTKIWRIIDKEHHKTSDGRDIPYSYVIYERNNRN